MKTIKLGFLGLGNIGGGVVRVIKMNGDHIEKQNGVRFELVRALVLDVNCVRTDLDMPDSFWTEDVSQIVEADDIDMIVEAMGGEERCHLLDGAGRCGYGDFQISHRVLLSFCICPYFNV